MLCLLIAEIRGRPIISTLTCLCREEELSEEEEDEEEPWEYDSEVLKQWEQFVKKSKATQVRAVYHLLHHPGV